MDSIAAGPRSCSWSRSPPSSSCGCSPRASSSWSLYIYIYIYIYIYNNSPRASCFRPTSNPRAESAPPGRYHTHKHTHKHTHTHTHTPGCGIRCHRRAAVGRNLTLQTFRRRISWRKTLSGAENAHFSAVPKTPVSQRCRKRPFSSPLGRRAVSAAEGQSDRPEPSRPWGRKRLVSRPRGIARPREPAAGFLRSFPRYKTI